jgi:hypothetical protein
MIYGSRNHLISGPRFAQSSDRRWSRVLHQQAIDTTTPAGRMFFQVTGAFAECERSMIRSRVKAGPDRAKARGVRLGRPRTGAKVEAAIRARLAAPPWPPAGRSTSDPGLGRLPQNLQREARGLPRAGRSRNTLWSDGHMTRRPSGR